MNLSGNLYLSNIPVACQGLPIKAHTLMLLNLPSAETTGTATSDKVTFTNLNLLAPLTVQGVVVTIDGWHIPTMWSYQSTLYLT